MTGRTSRLILEGFPRLLPTPSGCSGRRLAAARGRTAKRFAAHLLRRQCGAACSTAGLAALVKSSSLEIWAFLRMLTVFYQDRSPQEGAIVRELPRRLAWVTLCIAHSFTDVGDRRAAEASWRQVHLASAVKLAGGQEMTVCG